MSRISFKKVFLLASALFVFGSLLSVAIPAPVRSIDLIVNIPSTGRI